MVRSTTARTVALVANARATPGVLSSETAPPLLPRDPAGLFPPLTLADTTKVVPKSTRLMQTERKKIACVSGRTEAPPTRSPHW